MTEHLPAPRMTLITLGVNNLQVSTKFYHEGLGWPLSKLSNAHVSFFELDGVRLGLFGKTQLAEDAQAQLAKARSAVFSNPVRTSALFLQVRRHK